MRRIRYEDSSGTKEDSRAVVFQEDPGDSSECPRDSCPPMFAVVERRTSPEELVTKDVTDRRMP
jgi:hypothetical protein